MMMTQAIEVTGLDDGTLMNLKWVASCFETSCRHEVLSFGHHQEVAALAKTSPAEADAILDRAEKGYHGCEADVANAVRSNAVA